MHSGGYRPTIFAHHGANKPKTALSGQISISRRAQLVLHGSPWLYTQSLCHQMITPKQPKDQGCAYLGGGRGDYETQPPRFWENPGTRNCPIPMGGGGGQPPKQYTRQEPTFRVVLSEVPCGNLIFMLKANAHGHTCIIPLKGNMEQNGARNEWGKKCAGQDRGHKHPPTLIHPSREPISTHTPKNISPPGGGGGG